MATKYLSYEAKVLGFVTTNARTRLIRGILEIDKEKAGSVRKIYVRVR